MRYFFLFILMIGFTACSQSENKNEDISDKVEQMNSNDTFEQALADLEDQEQTPEVLAQKEEMHLNYGIHLIYNSDPSNMREGANNALRQFIEVLKINPENEKAKSEIEQILSIYRTFPDREPAEDVKRELLDLGFQI